MCPSNRALTLMESKGLVSIITPMYKGAAFVGETIESVLRQTYTDWEMIIVDDCSPDNGAGIQVVKRYKDPRIKLIESKVNKGSSGARNIALREAKGRYIAFLDSDDTWFPTYLEKQLAYMEGGHYPLVFSSRRRIQEVGNQDIYLPFIVPEQVSYDELLRYCPIFISTTVYDREQCGLFFFNEKLGSLRDDWVYWLSILRKIRMAYGNKEILGNYRIRGGSATSNKRKVIKSHWKVLRSVEQLPLRKAIVCFVSWLFFGMTKYKKINSGSKA